MACARHTHRPRSSPLRLAAFALPLLLLLLPARASAAPRSTLTGTWQDQTGQRYQLRQLDNHMYGVADARPAYLRVLSGTYSGTTVTLGWADAPDGQSRAFGNVTFRVDSVNKLTKIRSNGTAFPATALTRVGTPEGTTGAAAPTTRAAATPATVAPSEATGVAPGSAQSLAGTWKWFGGGTVIFYDDGTLSGGSVTGRWKLTDAAPRIYTLTWSNGFTDTMTLAANGQRMDGKNNVGSTVWGVRTVQTGTVPPLGDLNLVGPWKWFNGGTTTFHADGTINSGAVRGVWRLVDAARRTYTLTWSNQWVDTMTLSADGMRLDGKNNAGSTVWGVRITGSGTAGGAAGTTGADVCADPRTLPLMDQWLKAAIPPASFAGARYEEWGRTVGPHITVSGKPDTTLDRCRWLWQYADRFTSTTGLPSMKEYVEKGLAG